MSNQNFHRISIGIALPNEDTNTNKRLQDFIKFINESWEVDEIKNITKEARDTIVYTFKVNRRLNIVARSDAEEVLELLTTFTNITRNQLLNPSHKPPNVVKARAIAAFILKYKYKQKMTQIAKLLNFKSHASVSIICRKFKKDDLRLITMLEGHALFTFVERKYKK